MSSPQVMIRRLGAFDAVVIGLGSMIGAGVFAAFTPAANAAGSGLLIGLLVAAVVAFCNATSPAQLAAAYPSSGGTYIYGRERLGPWPGYLAGWGFVIGKAASTAAMAMTFAAYAAPAGWERPVAIAAVVVLAAVNYHGVSRIATMGEEVRNPGRTIPRAIMIALAITVVRYALNVLTLLASLGPAGVAGTPTPLANAVGQGTWVGSIVGIGAAVAALGALLALIAGLGRTSLAMARERDLPHWLPAIHPRYKVPHRAETVLAGVICTVILVADLRGAIGFSSFGVLIYYLVANIAAFTQPAEDRRYTKALQVLGALACVILVSTLPPISLGVGLGMFAVDILLRVSRLRTDRLVDS